MKIREHAIRRLEVERRIYEYIARAATCDDFAVIRSRHRLESPHGGGAAAEDAAAPRLACVDCVSRFQGNRKRLEIHVVVFDILRLDGAESAWADMERDGDALHTFGVERRKDLRREMQTRRRSGDGADIARVYGLVAFAIGLFFFEGAFALHVRRDGRAAEFVEKLHQGAGGREFHAPHPYSFEGLYELRGQFARRAELRNLPFAALPPGAYDAPPVARIRERGHEKDFDLAVRIGPLADDARRENFRVVYDQQIVWLDIFDYIADMAMLQHASGAMEHHHLLGSPPLDGMLGYKPLGERIPEQ